MVKVKEAVVQEEGRVLEQVVVELGWARLPELLAFVEELKAKVKELGASVLEAAFEMQAVVEGTSPDLVQELKAWAKELADPLGRSLGGSVRRG